MIGTQNPMTVAWLVQPCAPGNTVVFNWSIAYSVMWSQTGNLAPGASFVTYGSANVDPSQGDIQKFGLLGPAYSFLGPYASKGNPGTVGIACDGTVQNNQVSLALGMANKPVFACAAQPNINITFTPKPKYYLAFGQFQQGQIVDVATMSNSIELNYQAKGTYSFTAAIDAFNTWSLSP